MSISDSKTSLAISICMQCKKHKILYFLCVLIRLICSLYWLFKLRNGVFTSKTALAFSLFGFLNISLTYISTLADVILLIWNLTVPVAFTLISFLSIKWAVSPALISKNPGIFSYNCTIPSRVLCNIEFNFTKCLWKST